MTLRGVTVLITRQREQSADLVRAVEERGGRALVVPMIRVISPEAWDACDAAIDGLEVYDGAVFTSPNAVLWFFRRLDERRGRRAVLTERPIYAVGPSTRVALAREGIEVAGVPPDSSGEALADMLRARPVAGKRFLFPRGNLAGEDVVRGLEASGATVDSPVVYRTVAPDPADARMLVELTSSASYRVVVFASPSAVRNFAAAVPPAALHRSIPGIRTVAAGRTTAEAMRRTGFPVDCVSLEARTAALILALEKVTGGA